MLSTINSISLNGNGLLDWDLFVYVLDDVTASDNKTRVSRSTAERGPERGQMNKGKHLGFSRTKQSKKICRDFWWEFSSRDIISYKKLR